MSEMCANCGHERIGHRMYSPAYKRRCEVWVKRPTPEERWGGFICTCPDYDGSVLPAEGERLEFGVHRQREDHAETAQAWGPIGQLRRDLDRDADKAADAAMRKRT